MHHLHLKIKKEHRESLHVKQNTIMLKTTTRTKKQASALMQLVIK